MLRWPAASSAQVRNLRVLRQQTGSRLRPVERPARAGRKSARCHRWKSRFGSMTVGQDRASARELRNGRPGTQVHGMSRQNPGLGQGTRHFRPRLRPRTRRRGPEPRFRNCRAANRQGFGPDGEPAGKPDEAQAEDGLRRTKPNPRFWPVPRKSPKRTASPPRLGDTRRGTVGAGGNASPHFILVLLPGPCGDRNRPHEKPDMP